MPVSRHNENFAIMTVIYNELADFNFGDQSNGFRDARDLVSAVLEIPYEEISPYVKNMIAYSLNNYGEIVKIYQPHLVKWKWERLPLLTQAVLIMSYAHKKVEPEVDRKVIINTGVELAKKYIDPKQAKFINAILDGVIE